MANISQMKDSEGTVYDIDAVRVNGHTVNSDVPSNAVFTDTTYSVMTGATSSASGTSGLVPAPSSSGYNIKYLRADGSWATPAPKVKVIDYTITMLAEDESFMETITDSEITSNHFVVSSTIDPPACQASNWMVQCTSGELEIEGLVYPEDEDFDIDITLILAEGNNSESVATSIIEAPFYSDTTHYLVDKSKNGLCPKLPNETTTTKFLRQDRTWSVPDYPITGIKGNAESTYRTGDVNLTSSNIGALDLNGGTITGDLIVTGGISAEGISAEEAITTPFLCVDNPSEHITTEASILQVGNEIGVGTVGNSFGEIRLYGRQDNCTKLVSNASSADFEAAFPNKSGTVAMVSDITASKAGALPTTGGTLTGDLTIDDAAGTASADHWSKLYLGNTTAYSSAGHSEGAIYLYGKTGYTTNIIAPNSTAARGLTCPDKSGTIACTSDIPEAVAVKGNAESTYRTGNVNLTPANIGALALTGGTLSGNVTVNVPSASTSQGGSYLILGNNINNGTTGNSRGCVRIYGQNSGYTNLFSNVGTTNYNVFIPNQDGTIMLDKGGTFTGKVFINTAAGTTSTLGESYLELGNNKAENTAGNSRGGLIIYGASTSYTVLYTNTTTSAHAVYFPDKGGTIALTNDITASTAKALALTGGTLTGNLTVLTTSGNRILALGSSTASSYYGVIELFGKNGKKGSLFPYGDSNNNRGAGSSADIRVRLPNSSGLMALTSSSARRYKKDISYNINASLDPHKLLDLPMAQFKYREGADLQYFDMANMLIPGIIAEDVNTHYPAAVIHNSAGEIESWDERRLLPPMLALIQELYAKVEELTEQLNS